MIRDFNCTAKGRGKSKGRKGEQKGESHRGDHYSEENECNRYGGTGECLDIVLYLLPLVTGQGPRLHVDSVSWSALLYSLHP